MEVIKDFNKWLKPCCSKSLADLECNAFFFSIFWITLINGSQDCLTFNVCPSLAFYFKTKAKYCFHILSWWVIIRLNSKSCLQKDWGSLLLEKNWGRFPFAEKNWTIFSLGQATLKSVHKTPWICRIETSCLPTIRWYKIQ